MSEAEKFLLIRILVIVLLLIAALSLPAARQPGLIPPLP